MKEQNGKETEKKKDKAKKKSWLGGERKFYLFTAIGCAAALTAIIVVAVAVSKNDVNGDKTLNNGTNNEAQLPDDGNDDENVNGGGGTGDDEQVVVTPEGMVAPLETVSVLNEYGFYHNKTLNFYYEHAGVDFAAEAGTSVLAVEAGTIESIYKSDLLSGTEITIDHGDGLKSVYRFVTEIEGLSVGDTVKKGEQIATVAEANGNEYKDGAHLHLEIYKNNVNVDPAVYLTLEEK